MTLDAFLQTDEDGWSDDIPERREGEEGDPADAMPASYGRTTHERDYEVRP